VTRGSDRHPGPAVCAALGVTLGLLVSAHAQSKAPPAAAARPAAAVAAAGATSAAAVAKAAKPPKLDAAQTEARLARPETLASGLADVLAAGAAAKTLAPRIEELLQKGLPPVLAIDAVRALGAIGATSSSAVLAPYVQHRNADLRRATAEALGRTRGAEAEAALRRGLRSDDAILRRVSASGLRSAGGTASVPDLLRALDRDVGEAGPALGALCSGTQCDDLIGRLDKLAPALQKTTFEAMLERRPALPDDVLLRALPRVKVAAGTSAKVYFQGLKAAFKGSKKVQKALDLAARPLHEAPP
jgi:hypothetical protein